MSQNEGTPSLLYPKLPLWNAITLSYSTYFGNLAAVLRTSWLWLIVVAVLTGLASWQQWSWMAIVLTKLKPGQPPGLPPGEMAALLHASQALLLFAGVSIAVAWHRLMILNERPGVSGSNVATRNLWRYIGAAVAIVVIDFLPAAIALFLVFHPFAGGTFASGSVAVILLILVLYAFGLAAALRLSLLLPAQAVGNLGLTLGETWRRSRGNTWRLFWGLMATTTPPLLIAQFIFVAVIGVPGTASFMSDDFVARMTVVSTLTAMYYLLVLPIGIGFLSHAYRHFFQAPLEFTE
jgi:hypothetical protein